jgi:hypothetical protein
MGTAIIFGCFEEHLVDEEGVLNGVALFFHEEGNS